MPSASPGLLQLARVRLLAQQRRAKRLTLSPQGGGAEGDWERPWSPACRAFGCAVLGAGRKLGEEIEAGRPNQLPLNRLHLSRLLCGPSEAPAQYRAEAVRPGLETASVSAALPSVMKRAFRLYKALRFTDYLPVCCRLIKVPCENDRNQRNWKSSC